jgi:hypothetical protein
MVRELALTVVTENVAVSVTVRFVNVPEEAVTAPPFSVLTTLSIALTADSRSEMLDAFALTEAVRVPHPLTVAFTEPSFN